MALAVREFSPVQTVHWSKGPGPFVVRPRTAGYSVVAVMQDTFDDRGQDNLHGKAHLAGWHDEGISA